MIFKLVASYWPPWLVFNNYNKIRYLDKPRKANVSYPAIIEYLQALAKIYFKSKRDKRTQLLDDASKITGHHRKSLIRILKSNKQIKNNKKKNCGTKIQYPEALYQKSACT